MRLANWHAIRQRGTHVVFIRRGNRIDELLRAEAQLAGLGVLDGMAVEARLGLRRELLGLFRADERLLDRFLDGCRFRHGVPPRMQMRAL